MTNITTALQMEKFANYIADLEQRADLAFKNHVGAVANGWTQNADDFWQELEVLRTELRHAKKLGTALGLVGA
jgi:hypothetical protein